jgi:hypothetical protein
MSTPPYDPQQYPGSYPKHSAPKGKNWLQRHPGWGVAAISVGAFALLAGIGAAAGHGQPARTAADSTPAVTASATASPSPSPSPSPSSTTAASATAAAKTTRTVARSYPRVDALLSAMSAGGADCTSADPTSSTVTGAVGDIIDCSGAGTGDTVIAVFGDHEQALAYAHAQMAISNLAGGTPSVEVVGPDWTVNTVQPFARLVVKAVGGSLVTTSAGAAPVLPTSSAMPSAPPADTVTYMVSGDDAQVTYGPAGSDAEGSVPMNVTQALGDPAYYAINAQLQGGGQVSCEIEVDGQVISQSTATGGYNIAQCEISQDPLTGDWQNDNDG